MKKKQLLRTFILACVVTCGPTYSFSQEYSVKLLKEYKLPDIVRNSLEFELNSDGDFKRSSYENYDHTTTTHTTGKADAVFNRFKSTREFIGHQKLHLKVTGNYSRVSSGDTEYGYFSPLLQYNNSSRFYKGKLFFETGVSASVNYENYFGDQSSDLKYDTSIGGSIPLFVGKGRIEDVTDMRQAIYIAQALGKKGVLSKHITNDKMNEFAQIISTIKNKRFLDYRNHLEDEITCVDSFLINNGYVTNTNSKYFTTLYDYWLYGDLFKRRSGWEVSAGVTPGYYYNTSKGNSKYSSNGFNSDAGIKLAYENPTSLSWQHSADVGLTGSYQDMNIKLYDEKSNGERYSVHTSATYKIGYYPNTRTNLNVGISEGFRWSKNPYVTMDGNYYDRTYSTQLAFSTYYYVSPQLRIGAEANLLYISNNSTRYDYKDWTGSYVAKITYSLF